MSATNVELGTSLTVVEEAVSTGCATASVSIIAVGDDVSPDEVATVTFLVVSELLSCFMGLSDEATCGSVEFASATEPLFDFV